MLVVIMHELSHIRSLVYCEILGYALLAGTRFYNIITKLLYTLLQLKSYLQDNYDYNCILLIKTYDTMKTE